MRLTGSPCPGNQTLSTLSSHVVEREQAERQALGFEDRFHQSRFSMKLFSTGFTDSMSECFSSSA